MSKILCFKKRVGKAVLSNGRMTVPKDFDEVLNLAGVAPIHTGSRRLSLKIPNGQIVPAGLYQSTNNGTTYYQIHVSGADSVKIFRETISNCAEIEINLLLSPLAAAVSCSTPRVIR